MTEIQRSYIRIAELHRAIRLLLSRGQFDAAASLMVYQWTEVD